VLLCTTPQMIGYHQRINSLSYSLSLSLMFPEQKTTNYEHSFDSFSCISFSSRQLLYSHIKISVLCCVFSNEYILEERERGGERTHKNRFHKKISDEHNNRHTNIRDIAKSNQKQQPLQFVSVGCLLIILTHTLCTATQLVFHVYLAMGLLSDFHFHYTVTTHAEEDSACILIKYTFASFVSFIRVRIPYSSLYQ